jgi:hypothetical protein
MRTSGMLRDGDPAVNVRSNTSAKLRELRRDIEAALLFMPAEASTRAAARALLDAIETELALREAHTQS